MPAEPVRIVGLCGSLRQASCNRGLLRAAAGLLPAGASLEVVEVGDLPLFNQDLEVDAPDAVVRLRERVRAADAILFATPEYNYSIPGVLKNAIDWGSRPPQRSAWANKPCAMVGASTGGFGTVRAQMHLRGTLVNLEMHPLAKPELMVSRSREKFDAAGNLTDPEVARALGQLLVALVDWACVLRAGRAVVGQS